MTKSFYQVGLPHPYQDAAINKVFELEIPLGAKFIQATVMVNGMAYLTFLTDARLEGGVINYPPLVKSLWVVVDQDKAFDKPFHYVTSLQNFLNRHDNLVHLLCDASTIRLDANRTF